MVRFTPNDAKAAQVMPDTIPSQIIFSYDAKHVVAGMQTKDGLYAFAFQAICEGCVPRNLTRLIRVRERSLSLNIANSNRA